MGVAYSGGALSRVGHVGVVEIGRAYLVDMGVNMEEIKELKDVPSVAPEKKLPSLDKYQGVSSVPITPDEQKLLTREPEDHEVDIKPDGTVYMSWVYIARRLNEAIGIGSWSLVPQSSPQIQDNAIVWPHILYLRDHFVSAAVGECPYYPTNKKMTWASSAEGARSDALTRCAKTIGIGLELWDRRWVAAWREKHCVRVYGLQAEFSQRQQWLWRRMDGEPFYREGKPGKTQAADYVPPPSEADKDLNESHLDAIQKERG